MLRGLIAILTLAGGGCDNVFNLERVDPLPDAPLCPAPAGHDEDGDRLDDACDLCPGDADEMAIDTEGDGVGDACDPTPGSDSLVRFFAFATPGDFDHWTKLPVSVCSNDGESVVCAARDVSSTVFRLTDTPPPLPFAVQMSIAIDDVDRTNYDQIELQANSGNSGGPALRCNLIHAINTSGVHTESWLANTNAKSLLTNTYSGGTRFVMRMLFRTDAVTCELTGTRPDGEPFAVTANAMPSGPTPGAISMNVQRTSLRIDWVSIYKLAP